MRRIIFLLLIFVSFSSFAGTSRESAYASCLFNAVPGYQICIDDGVNRIYRKVISSSTSVQTYLYYQQCTNTSQIYNEITHVCYAPPDCPSPGVLTLNTTTGYKTCTSPDVTCPDGSTAPTQEQCSVQCTAPKYKLYNVCTDPPDCNASWPTGGQYFDYGTKSCATVSPITLCIGDSEKFCPPINDCKSAGYICTNDPAAVAAATAERTEAINTAKASADASAAKAADAATKTVTPIAAATQAKELAKTNVDAAKSALNAVTANPNSTATQLSDAVQAYGKALNALNAASTKLDNSVSSGNQVSGYSQDSQNHANAIPTDPTSGHAKQDAVLAGQAADNAVAALNDAIAGGGDGSGSGSGVQNSNCPDCAKESTLGDIAKNLSSTTGLGNYSSVDNTTEKGNFDDSISDAEAALDENKEALKDKMTEVKTGVSSLFNDSVFGGGGSLPTIDLGNMKGVNVSQDLNKFSPELSVVGTIIIAMAWVMALSITLSR